MSRIRLIHWHEREASSRIAELVSAGHQVDFDPVADSRELAAAFGRVPDVVVVDLSRLPARGRDVAVWLRRRQATRRLPIVFVGGEGEQLRRLRRLLPDAAYCDWPGIATTLNRSVANPPQEPSVPASNLAAYSGTPLPKKLHIKPGFVVALVHAPRGFEATLGELPEGVTLRHSGRGKRDLTICFVESLRQLRHRIDRLVAAADQGPVWIVWPKKSSPLASDVGQAEVRRTALGAGLVDYKICAVDEDWSGLLFARRRLGVG